MASELLSRAEAAKFLGISLRLLDELHARGEGPARARLPGTVVRYHPDALKAWARARGGDGGSGTIPWVPGKKVRIKSDFVDAVVVMGPPASPMTIEAVEDDD